MAIINLRDYYPFYTSDCFMEVSDEVAEMFKEFDRKEAAYRLRTYRHKAYYSLDRDDGLEHEAVFVALSPHELYERKVTMQELHAATASLPDKQAKRIYAHFILGMTKQDIARAEGVHEKVVRVAIERGLLLLTKWRGECVGGWVARHGRTLAVVGGQEQGGVKGWFRSLAIPRRWTAIFWRLAPVGIAVAVMVCGPWAFKAGTLDSMKKQGAGAGSLLLLSFLCSPGWC